MSKHMQQYIFKLYGTIKQNPR